MALATRAIRQLEKPVKTKYARIIIDFSIITLIGVVIFRNFFLANEWPGGGDVLGWISKAYLWRDFRWLYVWRQYSFGFVEGMAIRAMDLSFLSIYYGCGDPAVTVKIFLFLFFLIAGFSAYAFAYRFTHKHIASLSASMTYILNSWFFSQFTEAHADIIFSYALAPLIFLLVDRAFDRRKPKDVLALAIGLWVFLTSFHLESMVIYGAFLILFVILYILSAHAEGDNFRLRFKHFLKPFLPAFLIAISLSAFYYAQFAIAVPYVSPSYGYPAEWAAMDSYKNMTDAFMLKASEQWGYVFKVNLATGLSLPDFPISTSLLFLFSLAYATVFVLRRDRYTVFFGVATLISIFVSKGPNPPFGYIFTWAWFNIPYFSVFRAASRSVMMAALSHSFFVGILVSILTSYVQKIRSFQIKERFLNVKVMDAGSQVKEVLVSADALNNIVRGLRKFLYYSSLVIIVFVFLSGFLANWFFFNQGLQVYSPPNEYLQPYEWIAKKPGDYRVVTVGPYWDFADSSMRTDLGFGHDIGYDSSFIHDKPTLQDGGYDPATRAFVDHLRYYLAPQQVTNVVGKILGTFNYKYIVIPPYANAQTRDFFLHQQGTSIVYNNQRSLILENEYNNPLIFAAPKNLFVIGGLETFYSLSTIDTFNLSENALIFADQKTESLSTFQDLFNSSKALVLVDSDIPDLVMLSLKNRVTWINAAEYGVRSQDSESWIKSEDWRNTGKLVLGEYTLQTSGKNSINIPFKVDSSGLNDVWIRVGFGPSRGVLSVFIDNSFVGEINPSTNIWSNLKWVRLGSFNLVSGDHEIRLVNDGTGNNDVDIITIIPPSLFESEVSNMMNYLQRFPGRLIYVLQAESAFSYDSYSEWNGNLIPYDGLMFHTEGTPANLSPLGNASASSATDSEKHAIDGDIHTRWASSVGMPQWLQIDWKSPQEINGVQIVFEAAYAENYIIQTWNGTNWVNQVSVEGNKELERFHDFPSPVQTTKLRVYVTYAPAYYMVSIWELRAYVTKPVSAWTNISIPREGYYMFAARLASGPDYGTLDVKVNNFTTTIPCSSSNSTLNWRELGPVFLNAGEQKIFITANGKIDLDEIIVYSLKERKESLSLDSLFKPENAPKISVDQITQINPCKYTVSMRVENASEPFLLVFSEAYHPMWTAHVDSEEISPIPVYSIVNGFLINKTGEFTVTLYFKGQTYAEIGLSISIITMIVIAIFFTLKSNFFSRFLKKSK